MDEHREEFESYARKLYPLVRNGDGSYMDLATESAWRAYKYKKQFSKVQPKKV